MFTEYAIEPDALQDWQSINLILSSFGWEKGRVISQLPKNWKRKVYDSVKCGPVMKKRIEEKLNQIDRKLVKRSGLNFGKSSWQQNVLNIHESKPFSKIVVANPEVKHDDLLTAEEFDPDELPEPAGIVSRTPENIAAALSILLNSAKKLLFIDPYFDLTGERFKNAFKVYLEEISKNLYRPGLPEIEIHTLFKSGNLEAAVRNARYCLKEILTEGMKVNLFLWNEKLGGERFHNRYILSMYAGVSLGIGLDSFTYNKTNEDIFMMSSTHLKQRLKNFELDSEAYVSVCEPVEVKSE